ncbi:MAG: tetratricopeptide repeat protein [Caldimonas sp.]|nr:tetratricopeptide repeat protein [Pseudomonadota bacterium]
MDAFLATARGRLQQLGSMRDAGTLDAKHYERERRTIEREIGEHLLGRAETRAKPSRRLVGGLAVMVLAIAAIGYWKTGSPSLARLGPDSASAVSVAAAAAPDANASGAPHDGLQQIAAMVDKLEARMKERPDDAQGWLMLARSYSVLGRFDQALPAYKRADELQPNNATLLSDYADAVAASRGSVDNPESVALVARALVADPAQPKALALSGTIAFDRGDYKGAIERWQKMADALPADSDMLKQVQASIAEARQRVGASPAPAAPPAAINKAVAAAGSSVSGTVTLAPALAVQAARDDTVFVFARAVGGGRMPLAVQRAKVSDLPLSFKLDDSMAMTPTATLSSAKLVIIGARISKSGNAIPQAGDLSGEAAPVAPGTSGIAIRIDSVLGSR